MIVFTQWPDINDRKRVYVQNDSSERSLMFTIAFFIVSFLLATLRLLKKLSM